MAENIENVQIKLDVKGLGDIKAVQTAFKDFKSTLKLTRPQLEKVIKEITKVHGNTKLSTKAIKGQITALKEIQSRVGKATVAYKELGTAISRLQGKGIERMRLNIQAQRAGRVDSGFKAFSQDADEITSRANLAASGRAFLGSADAQLRPISGLAEQIQQIGLAQVDAKFQRLGQSVSQVRQDILGAAQAGGNNVNALNAQRAALETLRNGVDIGSQKFKQLTKDIQALETRLNSLTKFSGKNILGAAQGLLGATFVGGGAGLAGGLAGLGVEAIRPGGNLQQGAITGGLIGSQLISPAAQFVSGSAQYASGIAKSKIALEKATEVKNEDGTVNATASLRAYNQALRASTQVTKDFNIPQELAIRGMTRLGAAVIGAGGNVTNATRAFTNVLAAIKGTAGGTEDAKAAITALVQIYSKGRVSAEELSGQLGERFPAAVTKFADANDMTTQELQKSLKNGTVGLAQLEKFVIALGEEYIEVSKEIGASAEEAGARSQVAFNELRLALGNDLKEIGAEFQEAGINLMSALVPALKAIAAGFGDLARGLAAGTKVIGVAIKGIVDNGHELASVLAVVGTAYGVAALKAKGFTLALAGQKIGAAIAAVVKMTIALRAMTIAQIKANLAALANPYVALASGITAAVIAINRLSTASARMAKDLSDGAGGEELVNKAFKRRLEIQKEIKRLEDGKRDQSQRIANLRNEYDTLTAAIEAFRAKNTELGDELAKIFEQLKASGEAAKSPLESYAAKIQDVTTQIQEATVNAFQGMEDALTEFVMTGKLNFADFARSVIADLTRIAIRSAIIAPLGKAFGLPGFDTKDALGNVYGKNGIVPFAKGGVVSKPTIFGFANGGVGLMAEAGYPEAIMPLKRGRDGKLGVEASGGGSNIVNVTVNADSTTVEGNMSESKQLGEAIAAAIQQQLIMEQRPGGLLHG
tara:strand:+ start:2582 stop:5380 length:2799 start_codon:yes stop_codon:yes gene_type:complete